MSGSAGSTLRLSGRSVPVFDVREPADRAIIARLMATGRPAAFYMGLFTIMRVVGPPWRDVAGAQMFWTVKRDRPLWSKLPVLVRPSRALRLADFNAVHSEFRSMRFRERFERLWAHEAPMHVVTPLRRPHRMLPAAVVTTPDDLLDASTVGGAPQDRWLGWPTASMFWMVDPAWEELSIHLEAACPPRSWMVGSSFNDHGSPPPFSLDELVVHCAARSDLPFDLVVTDRLLEACGGFSSHSLVRLPMRDEPPALVMLRWGSVSPTWLTETTGYDVRVLDSTTRASRAAGLTDDDLRIAFEHLARRRRTRQPTRGTT